MKKLIPYILQPALALAVLADHYKGVTEAGNLAMFVIWSVIVISIVTVIVNENDDFWKKNPKSIPLRILFVITLLTLVWCGWFVTAAFYLFSWLLMLGKRIETEERNPTVKT